MENDNYSDEDNFTFNVKTDFSQAISNHTNQPKTNSKREKKEKYLEMKMLKNKRKREKVQPNKNLEEKENSREVQTNTKEADAKKEATIESTLLENKTHPEVKEDLYDELNSFYDAKEKKLKKLTHDEKNQQKTKKRALEKEIAEELKEVKVQKQLNNEIQIKKDSVFSLKNFEDLDINTYLKKTIAKNNFTQMTKIQKQTIPILLEHKNVIVKSETGSGKTLAYVIPLFEHLIKLNEINKIDRKEGVYSVIFAPTHELCMHIEETFNKL
jgi:ATP-dependent RNA helicase DDX31/DBP7